MDVESQRELYRLSTLVEGLRDDIKAMQSQMPTMHRDLDRLNRFRHVTFALFWLLTTMSFGVLGTYITTWIY